MTPIELALVTQPLGRHSSKQSQSGAMEGWPGALRSEVKEEARSEAVPGDMSAVKRPVSLTIEQAPLLRAEQP